MFQIDRQQLAIGYLFFINGVVFAAWATNIPDIKNRFSLSDAEVGNVLLIMAISAVVFMTFAGFLVQKKGSRMISALSALGFSAALPLVFFAENFAHLIIAVALLGAANGAMDVSMNQQASSAEQHRGRHLMSRLHACFSIGALAGSLLTYLALANGITPFSQGIALCATITVVACWLFRYLLADSRKTAHQRQHFQLGISAIARNRLLLLFGLLSFLTMLSEGGIADWSAIFLIDFTGVTADRASLGYAAYASLMIVGRLSGGWLISTFGSRFVVAASGALSTAGMSLALYANSFPLQLFGFALVGLGVANLIPIIFSNAGKMTGLPPGTGIAFVSISGYSGFLFGPVIIGSWAQHSGLDEALTIVLVVGIVMVLASQCFNGRPQQRCSTIHHAQN